MVLYTQFNPNLHGQVNIFHDFNTLSTVLYLIIVRLKNMGKHLSYETHCVCFGSILFNTMSIYLK